MICIHDFTWSFIKLKVKITYGAKKLYFSICMLSLWSKYSRDWINQMPATWRTSWIPFSMIFDIALADPFIKVLISKENFEKEINSRNVDIVFQESKMAAWWPLWHLMSWKFKGRWLYLIKLKTRRPSVERHSCPLAPVPASFLHSVTFDLKWHWIRM